MTKEIDWDNPWQIAALIRDNSFTRTPEERQRRSALATSQWQDEEWVADVLAKRAEYMETDEYKSLISSQSKERWSDPDYKESVRQKISAAHQNKDGKRVHTPAGVFNSLSEAARHYGISQPAMRMRMKRKSSVKNGYWFL